MTLIDLQGKALYSGDKEVKRAYLGEQVLYKLSGGIPTYAIEPQLAVYAGGGELIAYAGELDDFLARTEGTQTITSNGLYFEGDGHIQLSRDNSTTIEITVTNNINDYPEGDGTILSFGQTNYSDSGGHLDVTYTHSSSGVLTYYLRTGNRSIRKTIPAPDTEFITFAMTPESTHNGYRYDVHTEVYVNGELTLNRYRIVQNSTSSNAASIMRIGRAVNNSSFGYRGRFHLVDFKNYGTPLTPEEIMQSYQLLNL